MNQVDDEKLTFGKIYLTKRNDSQKKDSYVIDGGHMKTGEVKKNKKYVEINSTYRMEKIITNLNQKI